MTVRVGVIGVFTLVLGALCLPAAGETVVEAWRSPFGTARSVSVNPTDGSVWAATGSSVMHLAADGTVLSQTNGFWSPQCVSVNASDGSCWVADTGSNLVVHLSADGAELWRGGGFDVPLSVSANSADGSCWVGDWGQVVHLSASGAELWRGGPFDVPKSVSVNPVDGSCWVGSGTVVTHLSASGAELWRGDEFWSVDSVSVNPIDGSCWVASSDQVVHLLASGTELWRSEEFYLWDARSVSVNPADGSCWVADYSDASSYGKVVHVAASGAELWRSGSVLYWEVMCISVNATDGSCWVADHNQVIHLSAIGAELWRGGGFHYAYSVSVNSTDGSCCVTDTGNGQVVHLSAGGTELWRRGGFDVPLSVSVNPADGSCWVGDLMGQVVHLSANGVELWRGEGFNYGVQSVSANPTDGSCWVADLESIEGYSSRVVHLSVSGVELWGGGGVQPLSVSVNASDGSCWVGDSSNHLVVHLSASGEELWRGGTFGSHPGSVSVNPTDGSCWVADTWQHEVVHLSESGVELWRGGGFGYPESVSVNSTDGSCWVADTYNNQVVHLSESGMELWRGGWFDQPYSVSVNPTDGSCWVVDSGNKQVVHLVIAGSSDEFLPYVADVTTIPAPALDGYEYYLKITVGNRGGLAGSATIAVDEYNLSGITMAEDYCSPDPPVRTKTIPAYGTADFYFCIRHRWEWISAPPADWQAILDGAISLLPVSLIQQWACDIQAADDLAKVKQVYDYVNYLIQGYGLASGLLHDTAGFRYLPGPETTSGLTFDTTVTVQVPDWKTSAFWTSTGFSVGGSICSKAGNLAGAEGWPLLAIQALFKYAAHEYYEIAYDPDPDYMTLPVMEPIEYPELDALADSPGKAAALAAKAWAEVETARVKAWVRMAAAEQAGNDYWRLRQAQAAEEFGSMAQTRIAEFQRLLPAVPGLQLGSTPEQVAAFRQELEANGLPEIESIFLLRQGWTQDELDALVQSMLDTTDEIYETPGLQADAAVLAGAGALAQTHYAAEIAESAKATSELPTTFIIPTGTIARDGKYVSDVMVLLEPTSPTATAIAGTDYSVDEGAHWTAYAGPFTISEDGTTTILARATDSVARVEDPPARRVITKRPSVFSDVPFGSWAWAETEAAYWYGIVQGYTDGLYHPEFEVTRDQMAVYVSRAVGTPTGSVSVADYQPPSTPSFSDVPVDNWAYRNTEYAVTQNIVQGYPEGDYKPQLEVRRDQMAVYTARSMVAPTGEAALAGYVPSDPRNFPDVPSDFWSYKHIEYCVEHSVVQGYDDGLYHPEIVVTRDQMAVYVARAFQLPL